MGRHVKSTLTVAASLCWLAASFVIAGVLYQYLTAGAGLQVLGLISISSASILLGLAHVIGIAFAALVCLVLGIIFCAQGLTSTPPSADKPTLKPTESFAIYRHAFSETFE